MPHRCGSERASSPPGGGQAASVYYTYQGARTPRKNVPLYDIAGSTVAMIDVANPNSSIITYKYDPYGMVTTSPNNQRPSWPFLYQGMEQEYLDSWKLYWQGDGSVYNPDPFQLSLDGPQGLGGGS